MTNPIEMLCKALGCSEEEAEEFLIEKRDAKATNDTQKQNELFCQFVKRWCQNKGEKDGNN